jgi:hypothetical protein
MLQASKAGGGRAAGLTANRLQPLGLPRAVRRVALVPRWFLCQVIARAVCVRSLKAVSAASAAGFDALVAHVICGDGA